MSGSSSGGQSLKPGQLHPMASMSIILHAEVYSRRDSMEGAPSLARR